MIQVHRKINCFCDFNTMNFPIMIIEQNAKLNINLQKKKKSLNIFERYFCSILNIK